LDSETQGSQPIMSKTLDYSPAGTGYRLATLIGYIRAFICFYFILSCHPITMILILKKHKELPDLLYRRQMLFGCSKIMRHVGHKMDTRSFAPTSYRM
jgi:hypothetical protein